MAYVRVPMGERDIYGLRAVVVVVGCMVTRRWVPKQARRVLEVVRCSTGVGDAAAVMGLECPAVGGLECPLQCQRDSRRGRRRRDDDHRRAGSTPHSSRASSVEVRRRDEERRAQLRDETVVLWNGNPFDDKHI